MSISSSVLVQRNQEKLVFIGKEGGITEILNPALKPSFWHFNLILDILIYVKFHLFIDKGQK